MADRREFLIGGACLATLGMAEWLRPREEVKLFESQDLAGVVPRRFGTWRERPTAGVITPTTPDSLADRLYSETLIRTYEPQGGGLPIMLLIAYGGVQSDLLQLHRPEACYPAVGFAITEREPSYLPIGEGARVPAVRLTARQAERVEDIAYWTRMGEYLPRTAAEQRRNRLSSAMAGMVGDGILVRASTFRLTDEPVYDYVESFLSDMVLALPTTMRKGFVGSELAAILNRQSLAAG